MMYLHLIALFVLLGSKTTVVFTLFIDMKRTLCAFRCLVFLFSEQVRLNAHW